MASYTDDFTGTANPIGGNWSTLPGVDAMKKNDAAASATGSLGGAYWNANTFTNDQYSQCVILGYGGAGFDSPALALRYNGSNYYIIYLRFDGTRITIQHYNSGSFTQIGTYETISAFTVGHTLRAEITGDNLTVKDNGSTIRTWDVSSVGIASGAPGIMQYANTDYRIDDWEGGDLGSSTTPLTASGTSALGSYADSDPTLFKTHSAGLQDDLNA